MQTGIVKFGDSGATRVLFGWENNRLLLTDFVKFNHPREAASLQEELDRTAKERIEGWSIQLSFEENAYRRRGPEVSMLRSAYLIAFAAFGYRYICREALEPIREQIRRPYEEVVAAFCFVDKPPHDFSFRRIVVIRRPKWYQSVLVQMGPFRIYLPIWDDASILYEKLEEVRTVKPCQSIKVSAREFLWPSGPEFLFDYKPRLFAETYEWLR